MNTPQEIQLKITAGCDGAHEREAEKMAEWMPNLIIIGAPKSATSTLAYTLSKHENVFCCSPSEPKFFGSRYHKGWDWYSKIFQKGRKYKTRIEASTKYASSEDLFSRTPELIHRYAPTTKLVYLARSPIERTVSHWRHFKGRFSNKAVSDFSEILDDENLTKRIVQCSMYFEQINRFRQYFSDSQIHCMTFEDLTKKPIKTLNSLFKFANINGHPKQLMVTNEDGERKLPHKNQAGAKKRTFIEAPEISNAFNARLRQHFKSDSEKFLNHIKKPANYWG